MPDARRLISYKGRLLRSHYGRLVATPVIVVPDPATSDSYALGDGATVSIVAAASVSDGYGLSDGVSSNPPSVSASDSFTLGDGAAISRIHRPTTSDAIGLTDGATGTVQAGTSETNTGPYPRMTMPSATYDTSGKVFKNIAAGTPAFNNVTSMSAVMDTAAGMTWENTVLLNGAGTFTMSGTNVQVANGQTVGAAGTAYEIEILIMTNQGNFSRYARLTAA